MLTASERRVLDIFRQFLSAPGEMVCFNGPQLASHNSALRQLSEKGFLATERFKGGYSLTPVGYAAMKENRKAQKAVAAKPTKVRKAK